MKTNSNTKVCFLLGSLNRGGAETLLLDVLRDSKKNNLNVMVIYRKKGVLENDFKSTEVSMNFLPFKKNILSYLIKLRKVLLREDVEIVHSHQFIDAFYAYLACLGTKKSIVLTTHGYDLNFSRVANLIHHFIIRKTDLNIYVSNYQKNYYEEKYQLNHSKQTVVYNGISFEKLFTPTNNQSIRTELKIAPDTQIFGMVGNFVKVRNHFFICKFIEKLRDNGVDFHFVFIGKRSDTYPELFDNCKQFIHDHQLSSKVSFLGTRSDVPTILKELDSFVYATDHDTFGIAVVEAIAIGIPVFVNDWEVMKEISGNGEYATLYKTNDLQDLYEKFEEFLSNSQQFKEKAIKASDYVQKEFGIQHHIELLKKNYADLKS